MHRLLQSLRLLLPFLWLYLLAILIFFVFRIVLFCMNTAHLDGGEGWLAVKAFAIGCRFDTTVICYILFLPVFIYAILTVINKCNKLALKIIYAFCGVLFSIAFFISTADIPFFNQFFVRFNNTAFLWKNDIGFAATMILKEKSLYLFFLLYVVVEIFFVFFLRLIYRYHRKLMKRNHHSIKILPVFILSMAFIPLCLPILL